MKYALVSGQRQEAQQGLSGKCTYCDHSTIAKCGKVKIWHWAHKGKLECDPWLKDETEWHRAWKEQFPEEWQEVHHVAENGEIHRADVKTDQGYVIEFQNSPIKPGECQSRENFYKKMIWIVNGVRRLRDKDKFIDVWEHSHPLDSKIQVRRLRHYFEQSPLLGDWGNNKVPVFFDFSEDILLGLLPKTIEKGSYAFKIRRNELIAYLRPAPQMSFDALLKSLADFINAKEKLATVQQSFQPQVINRLPRRNRWPL